MSASTESSSRSVVRLARHPRRPSENLAEAVAPLDKRTRLGKDIQAFRTELVRHVGGEPSATQAALIELAVQLRLRLASMDARFAECGEMSAHDSRTYLAWSNSLARTVRQLGLKSAAQRGPTLAEYLSQRKMPLPQAPSPHGD